MKTYWITKYALTDGIFEIESELYNDGMVMDSRKNPLRVYYHTGDFHDTHELAIAKAEKMRAAKIKNLRKQIEKLEALKFE